MSTCEKYVTDDVIVIGCEKTFSRSARQPDKHCAPRKTILEFVAESISCLSCSYAFGDKYTTSPFFSIAQFELK